MMTVDSWQSAVGSLVKIKTLTKVYSEGFGFYFMQIIFVSPQQAVSSFR